MLGWTMMDLAKAAKVSISMIKRLEGSEVQRASDEVATMIHDVMTKAGVSFLADNGEGPGLRLLANLPTP